MDIQERVRIKPDNDDWFKYDESNYKEIVKIALKKVICNMTYFDNK